MKVRVDDLLMVEKEEEKEKKKKEEEGSGKGNPSPFIHVRGNHTVRHKVGTDQSGQSVQRRRPTMTSFVRLNDTYPARADLLLDKGRVQVGRNLDKHTSALVCLPGRRRGYREWSVTV